MANNESKIKDEQIENLTKQIKTILEKIEEISPKATKAYEATASKISDIKDDVTECCSKNKIVKKVKDNPVHSTLVLLTVGVVIGAIFNKYKNEE